MQFWKGTHSRVPIQIPLPHLSAKIGHQGVMWGPIKPNLEPVWFRTYVNGTTVSRKACNLKSKLQCRSYCQSPKSFHFIDKTNLFWNQMNGLSTFYMRCERIVTMTAYLILEFEFEPNWIPWPLCYLKALLSELELELENSQIRFLDHSAI